MASSKKRVEIVFPFFNRKKLTLLCLKSLSRLEVDGLDVHIVAVDDGSSDGTADDIRESYPAVEIIQGDGNLWFTEGTNVGIRAALKHDPDYVLMINDDAVFDSKFLLNLVKTAEENKPAVVGSLLLLWDTPHKLFQVSPRWETWSGGWRHWLHQTVWTVPDKPWEVELIVGNCVLVPAEAIKECGLMDSARLPHYGDAEYTPRLKRHGWKLLVDPSARVFCQPNDPPPSLRKMSIGKFFRTFVLDLGNANSLRRRLYGCLLSGHGTVQGLMAFFVFYLRYLLGKNAEGEWALRQIERPLKETFADRVLK